MNPDQQIQLREEALRWIFSILGAIAVYLVVAAITLNVYHPDIEQLRKIADELLLPDVGDIARNQWKQCCSGWASSPSYHHYWGFILYYAAKTL